MRGGLIVEQGEFYVESRNSSTTRSDRYRNSTIYKDIQTGEVLLSSVVHADIPVLPNDTYHRVRSHETTRLDILAHTYYSNPLLWWVIAQANEIYDPFVPLEPGTLLRIPAIESLYGHSGILL